MAAVGKFAVFALLLLGSFLISAAAELAAPDSTTVLTTIRDVRHLAKSDQTIACTVKLEGVVLWANPNRQQFILQDASGGMRIQMDLRSQPLLQAGQKVLLTGRGLIDQNGFGEMLINNDGIHPAIEKMATLYLPAGLHPIRVDWFNAYNKYILDVSLAGPGLPRQPVPDSILFRPEKNSPDGKTNWVNGLDYRCYEGAWETMPDFATLAIAKSGVVSNFDVSVETREDNVGLEFNGFIKITQAGLYTFWNTSDDGSFLFIDSSPLQITALGKTPLPIPRAVFAGQPLAENEDCQWSEIEGTVTFINDQSGSMDLELSTSTGLMHLQVKDPSAGCARLWLNSRIRAFGISQSTLTTDNRRVCKILLVPDAKQIQLLEPASVLWTEVPLSPINQLTNLDLSNSQDALVHIRGKVQALTTNKSLIVEDAGGQILVETAQSQPDINRQIDVLGKWTKTGTNILLQDGFYREVKNLTNTTASQLPLLTSIEEVKSLSLEEAQKGYPVKIRGVVTAPITGGFFIQDETWAILARWEGLMLSSIPQIGDMYEVEGITFAEFSPNIQATRIVRLSAGTLPAPIHATLDQLINGSMDTRYVEIQGIVTSTKLGSIQLLTHEGSVKILLTNINPLDQSRPSESDFKQYENTLIRIRGCVIPGRDEATEQVQVGQFSLCSYSITIDQLAPRDPFSVPLKSVADLRKFDPHASILQLVRVAGQIIHKRDGQFFLWDGANGLRFVPRTTSPLKVGDTVQVVGFLDWSGHTPILREASVQLTGHGPLPLPRLLSSDLLLDQDYDNSLVRIQAKLTDVSVESSDQILTMQAKAHGFIARLNTRQGLRPDYLPGSRLELTGVYVGQGGGLASSTNIDSFELLINSPADIVVLEHPSWWTLERLLMAFGVIVLVLAGAILWIFTLRRRVHAQTLVIHQKVEREATLEERARIARDIHDTLEQALAGTSFQLNALARSLENVPAEPLRILNVARSMVRHAQEEAWRTVRNLRFLDLEKDDLPSALSRLAAQSGVDSPVEIRVNVKGTIPALSSKVESHLLRVSQEATTNAIKHARAKIIQLELTHDAGWLQLTIQDDGCGFDVAHAAPTTAGHFGLLGMRERAEKIGGTLQILSVPGQGTTIQVKVPLSPTQPTSPKRDAA